MKNSKVTGIAVAMIVMVAFIGSLTAQVATQNRETGSFSGIHNKTSADVFVKQGDAVSVMVKADEEAIDKLTTTVEDGTLVISSKNNGWRNVRVMEVHVTMPRLDMVKNTGSGNLTTEGTFPGNNVYVGIDGSGDVDLSLEAKNLEMKINGSGDVKLSGVRGELHVGINGSGDVLAENLQLELCEVGIRGSGDVKLKGSAAKLILKQSGSGDVNAYALTSAEVIAKSYGSGDAIVQAAERIEATLNGSGDLSYYGSPEYVDVEARGSGEAYRKK
jgi:hypothetical protein